jgi:16S rRNA C967 or C1407 C5-methylase (RsmB/RsmF family)/NOL1/NOP2/fmu family ribosome biogenesis protein
LGKLLPDELLQSLTTVKGFDENAFTEAHYHPQQITSVRFNANKYERFNHTSTITHPSFVLNDPVPWCDDAFYLDERPQFTFDPLLHAGAYYVQEASSMFLWEALKQNFHREANIKVLDLCAAPGGKSSLLVAYFSNALIVSNEVIKTRATVLYENLTKWGSPNTVITNNDAEDFKRINNYFDLMVIDAPCSGSGLFRKDTDAINEWSENNVQLCGQRQQRIIADAYASLKHDGVLIYSTCSYSQEEDEDILDWIKDNFNVESIKLRVDDKWNIIETISDKHKRYGYRFWPDKIKGEGFFISVLKKNEEGSSSKQHSNGLTAATGKEINILQPYITENDWLFFQQKEIIRVIQKQWNNDVAFLQKNLYLRKAGVQLGEIKGKDLVPHVELALSLIVNDNVKKIELDHEQSLQYLRKKELSVMADDKGWALCTHQNFPLGWIKILHNRVNNYYPTEWRIRKE